MANVVARTFETYRSNLKLVLVSAIGFAIAFLVPLFASLPTYNDLGGVFLRTSSIYLNLNLLSSAVIVVSFLFSLIFISFAIAVINVIVKHNRTRTRVKSEVFKNLEKFTGRIFLVLLIYSLLVLATNILTFGTGYSAIATALVGLVLSPLVFFTPASIVIDEKGVVRAMKSGVGFFFKRFDYFLLWLVLAIILISVLDFVFIAALGTLASRYVMLILTSIFVLPFLLLLQGEMYINKFGLLNT